MIPTQTQSVVHHIQSDIWMLSYSQSIMTSLLTTDAPYFLVSSNRLVLHTRNVLDGQRKVEKGRLEF